MPCLPYRHLLWCWPLQGHHPCVSALRWAWTHCEMVKGLTAKWRSARITLAPSPRHTRTPEDITRGIIWTGAQCLHSSFKSSSVKFLRLINCKAQTFSRAFSISSLWTTVLANRTLPSHLTQPWRNNPVPKPCYTIFSSIFKLSWKKRKKALSEVWLCNSTFRLSMLNSGRERDRRDQGHRPENKKFWVPRAEDETNRRNYSTKLLYKI